MSFEAKVSIEVSECLLAVGVAVSSLELLYLRDSLRDQGLLSWRIHCLWHPAAARIINQLSLGGLFRFPGILGLICLRLAGALALVLCALIGFSTAYPLAVITLSTLMFTLRSPEGNDGSDQMASVALLACALSEAVGTDLSRCEGLAFLAAQASLAYCTSGFLKLFEKGWRNGSFILGILKTSSFGNRQLLNLVRRQRFLAVVFGCLVAGIDSLLGVAILIPPRECIVVLGMGVLLHIGIGAVLGLNTFLWSFVATYPAVLWASIFIHTKLFQP